MESDLPLRPTDEWPVTVHGRHLVVLVYPVRRADAAPYVPVVVATARGAYVALLVQTRTRTHVLDGATGLRPIRAAVEAMRDRIGQTARGA